jgi:hypothetical protein
MYSLQKLLWDLRRDPDLAARYRQDPAAVVDAYGLSEGQREALLAGDFRTLYEAGVNPYLLYFCALQIGVDRAAYYANLRGQDG